MRTFENFPKDNKCPICGTNDNRECILVGKYGTQEKNICQAIPVHADCLLDKDRKSVV